MIKRVKLWNDFVYYFEWAWNVFIANAFLLNVNVYGPTKLKSLLHIFESVYTKWNVGLNSYFVFVYVLVNEFD